MIISKFTPLFSFVLLLATNGFAHAQSGVCRVTAFSIDHSIPHSASFSDPAFVGEFELKFKGSMIFERFQHKESRVTVFVNITRVKSTLFNNKPTTLRLAIQLEKGPEDSYSFYGGAAESVYDKNWKGSSVSSHIRLGDYKGYTFTVACEKQKK
jgi:hypothetical protein